MIEHDPAGLSPVAGTARRIGRRWREAMDFRLRFKVNQQAVAHMLADRMKIMHHIVNEGDRVTSVAVQLLDEGAFGVVTCNKRISEPEGIEQTPALVVIDRFHRGQEDHVCMVGELTQGVGRIQHGHLPRLLRVKEGCNQRIDHLAVRRLAIAYGNDVAMQAEGSWQQTVASLAQEHLERPKEIQHDIIYVADDKRARSERDVADFDHASVFARFKMLAGKDMGCGGHCFGLCVGGGTEFHQGWLVPHQKIENAAQKARIAGCSTQLNGLKSTERKKASEMIGLAGKPAKHGDCRFFRIESQLFVTGRVLVRFQVRLPFSQPNDSTISTRKSTIRHGPRLTSGGFGPERHGSDVAAVPQKELRVSSGIDRRLIARCVDRAEYPMTGLIECPRK